MSTENSLLEVKNLVKHFPVTTNGFFRRTSMLQAVDDVSLTISAGETLGIVGESGCGKSSLAKTIARLYNSTAGSIYFDGQDITQLTPKQLQPFRTEIQYVFQDPYESLNPRHTVESILEEPFKIHTKLSRIERKARVESLLDKVGLPHSALHKYPHEFSGGQRQRIGIARAVALKPKLLICDEPVSALDVSVQSQIVNLLLQLQKDMGLAILFIAHDLSVVKHVSDHIGVMYLGKIVEYGRGQDIYQNPSHPYTQFLIDAIPSIDIDKKKKRRRISGELPSPVNPPSGCRFRTRCPLAQAKCAESSPESNVIDSKHVAYCHYIQQSQKHWKEPWDSSKVNAR